MNRILDEATDYTGTVITLSPPAARLASRTSALKLAVSAASLALLVACSGDHRPPNIVLIVIDTLRADHLSCYGYHRPTSPHIDALAGSGTLFEHASSVSSHTRPATASLLTGNYPAVHGAVGFEGSVSPDVQTLAETLGEAGYRTIGFHRNGNVSERFGFGRGFDRYVGVEKGVWHELRRRTPRDVPLLISQVDDSLLTRHALAFLREIGSSPFFLYLHLADPHDPYTPPRDSPLFPSQPLTPTAELFYQQPVKPKAKETPVLDRMKLGLLPLDDLTHRQMIDLYDAEIGTADEQVGRILAGLVEAGLSEETVVFLTSDHGEEFWDHGGLGHGQSHYQELLHVPLIAAGPGIERRRLAQPVSLIDLVPTIMDLAGLEAGGLPGRSLRTVLTSRRRKPAAVPVYSESLMRMDFHGDPLLLRSVRTRDLKLVLDFRFERKLLFDLAADPGEQKNLGGEASGRRRQLLETLIQAHTANLSAGRRITAVAAEIPEDLEARLRALGYVGGEGEGSAPSFIRRPLRLIDTETYGFLGHETGGASYRSALDFSFTDIPEEQLLYGIGKNGGAAGRRFARKAGARLRRDREHRKWRLTGVVIGPQEGGELRFDVRLDGGEPDTRRLERGRRFAIEGTLPPERSSFVRLDFECDRGHFVARGERSDAAATCLRVESLRLSG